MGGAHVPDIQFARIDSNGAVVTVWDPYPQYVLPSELDVQLYSRISKTVQFAVYRNGAWDDRPTSPSLAMVIWLDPTGIAPDPINAVSNIDIVVRPT